jgi:hypothetical protein
MAAKKIQVSDDNGTNWYDLPGSTGSFSVQGEALDDTILGQSFQSNHPGIIDWQISSNAIWKGFAGYLAEVFQAGSSTVMTTEAMTLVSGKTYKITNAAKNVWNRAVTLNVFDNGVNHNADVLNVDYLFGRVTFKAAYTVTGPVTVTGAYFPMAQLGKGNSFTLTQTANMIDNTDFATAQANGGYRTHTAGLRTVEIELGGTFDATVNSKDDVNDRLELIVQIDPVGDGLSVARGFFRLLSAEQTGDVGALEEETLQLSLSVPVSGAFTIESVFKWLHESGTTIPTAIQKILNAWQNEVTIDVRYLPTGATGASPLDGVAGDALVSDVSLSGGISEMNIFEATFMGTGAYTEV